MGEPREETEAPRSPLALDVRVFEQPSGDFHVIFDGDLIETIKAPQEAEVCVTCSHTIRHATTGFTRDVPNYGRRDYSTLLEATIAALQAHRPNGASGDDERGISGALY